MLTLAEGSNRHLLINRTTPYSEHFVRRFSDCEIHTGRLTGSFCSSVSSGRWCVELENDVKNAQSFKKVREWVWIYDTDYREYVPVTMAAAVFEVGVWCSSWQGVLQDISH